MNISKIIKKIPRVKRFITRNNPQLGDLINNAKIFDKPNPIVLDVGANTGQSIDFFLKMRPKSQIYSFEPTPVLAKQLRNRFKNLENVNIFEIALSDYNGDAELFVSENSPTNLLLKPDFDIYKIFNFHLAQTLASSKKETCRVETLNTWYFNHLYDKNIDLLKIDVQGAEYLVIKGATDILRNKVKALTIEIQYLPFYKKTPPFYELFKVLYENDFQLFSFYESSKTNSLQVIENNALLINKNFIK